MEFIELIYRVQALGEANKAQGRGRPFALRLLQTPISGDELQCLTNFK